MALVLDRASAPAIHGDHASWRKQRLKLWKPGAFAGDDGETGGSSFYEDHPQTFVGRRMEQDVGSPHERENAPPREPFEDANTSEDVAKAMTG